LGLPVMIHIADPVAFFTPLDERNERWDELSADPEAIPGQGRWRIYGLYLPDDVLEKIYWKNAAKVLKISKQ